MSEPYLEPRSEVSFGDIFDVDFLHDVHLRADAVLMGPYQVPQKFGGGWAYGPMYGGKDKSLVLGHGKRYRAILITDNCVIDTALAQREQAGGRPKGRLLFAPILESPGDASPITHFGRFPLPAWESKLPPGVAELRRCFMVDSRDVADHVSNRLASLEDDRAEQLEIRWNAFAARRGPLAATRNSNKLAGLLARRRGEEQPTEDELALGISVAESLTSAWRLEGSELEAVGDAFDAAQNGAEEIWALEAGLRKLADEAQRAADLIRTLTANAQQG